MAMLKGEGFRFEGYVDVFDAGPQVHAERDAIATVRNSRVAGVATRPASLHLVSAGDLASFRVTTASAFLRDGELTLDRRAIAALGLSRDDRVRACPAETASASPGLVRVA
jgi:arginine N-succinyltransferase